jgi:gas vesicle structural protein
MAVERAPGGSSLIDVLDRVLDKGVVIDAYVRVSLVGIDLVTVEARVVVASIETYLKYYDHVGLSGVHRPRELPASTSTAQMDLERALAENAALRKELNALS